MSKELKKPEDYVSGSGEMITTFLFDNILQTFWVIIAMVWLGSAMWTSINDVFSGNFEHKVLSYTFIVGILLAGYLKINKKMVEKKIRPKVKKKKRCSKCDSKKKQNV